MFFRAFIKRHAQRLEVTGWVRNLPAGKAGLEDRRVEIVAEGEKSKLTKLIKLIKKGPPLSRVDSVDVSWQKASREFEGFEIVK